MRKNTLIICLFIVSLYNSCTTNSIYQDLPRVEQLASPGSNAGSGGTSGSTNWQLETLPLTGITTTSANGGANFISYGSGTISNKGLCYSEQPSSTINELLVSAGSGNANFTCQIPDLNPNTTFNVRLFVTLDNTTIYGNEQSFNTLTNPVSLVTTYDCSSLSGFTTYYEGMNNSYGAWGLSGSGYDGSCLIAPNPNNSGNLGSTVGLHYIELATNFNNNGFIELWLNTFKRGNNNLIPQIYVDGFEQTSPEVAGGGTLSFDWMKIQTSEISSGQHTITIIFSASYYVLKIDDMEQYEY